MNIFESIRRVALLALGVLCSASLTAQDTLSARPASEPRLRVFLDCERGCDRDFFLITIPFVLFTQDRLDADIHALITGLNTAAGGREYTIALLGRGLFAGRADTLRANIVPNATDDMRRREMGRVLQIGLFPYAVRVSGPAQFAVQYVPPVGNENGIGSRVADPWNFWVYRVRANGSGSAEQLNSSYQITGGVNISRTTETWKVSLNTNEEYRANTFTLSSGENRNFILRSTDVSARLVRSVTEHWSLGAHGSGGRSDFRNQSFHGGLEISGEYNVFPWKEATSRQLIALVALGARHFDYQDTTIFGRQTETRPIARAIVAAESRQQWGTIDASLRYTQFLHDAAIYNVSFNGRAQIRLTRGLALELRGEAAKVNDQIFYAAAGPLTRRCSSGNARLPPISASVVP